MGGMRRRGWALAGILLRARTHRLLAAWAAVVAIATGVAVAGRTDVATPQAAVAAAAGSIVVDRQGRPVRGRDGQPLRVAADGRTVVDSRGRPVRDRRGRALRVGPTGRLGVKPRSQRRARRPDRRKPPRRTRPTRRPGSTRPAATATPQRDPIVVGLVHMEAESYNRLAASQGGSIRVADAAAQARAVIAHLNAGGGIGGRRVELRATAYDRTDHRGLAVELAEACAHLREGARPVAVLHAGNEDVRDLGGCLQRAGIPYLFNWSVGPDAAAMEALGTLSFGTGSPGIDRVQRPYVETLADAGFFRGARVGVLLPHRGESDRRAGRLLLDLLAAKGVKPVAQAQLAFPDSVAYLGDFVARIGNAVVEFRSARVDRVVSVDFGGETIAFFMKAARSQDYFPRYGLTSAHSPSLLKNSGDALYGRARSIDGAVGIGWAPILDVLADHEPEPPATRRTCEAIYARANVDVGTRAPAAMLSAMHLCDSLLALERVIGTAGGDTSAAAVRGGFEGLGTGFASGLGFETLLGPGRHNAANGYRELRYEDDCHCFRYRGPVRGLG